MPYSITITNSDPKMYHNLINNEGPERELHWKGLVQEEKLFATGILIKKYLDSNKNVYACIIDFSKAFYTVKNKEIGCLQSTDFEENYIALIANLYWQQTTNNLSFFFKLFGNQTRY